MGKTNLSDYLGEEIKNRLKNLSAPPRKVSLGIRSKMLMGRMGYIGALLIIMFFVFFYLFFIDSRKVSAFRMSEIDSKTLGQITKIKVAKTIIGSYFKRRGSILYKYYYKFRASNGRTYNQFSFDIGTRMKIGDEVVVEYIRANPKFSRIREMSYSTSKDKMIFSLIAPIIGFFILLSGLFKGIKYIALLKNGEIADGKIISKQATKVSESKQPVYKYNFEFIDETNTKQQGYSKSILKHELCDEENEPVIYIPGNSVKAELIDSLPKEISLDNKGNWITKNGIGNSLCFMLTGIIVLGCTLFSIVSIIKQIT